MGKTRFSTTRMVIHGLDSTLGGINAVDSLSAYSRYEERVGKILMVISEKEVLLILGEQESVPRSEYPRPQFVRDNWLNLNGTWEFEIDHDLPGEARGLHSGGVYTKTITVPFCPESELSGIGEKGFIPAVWYRRSFEIPEQWRQEHKRILLHFGAVDYDTTVWINGKRAMFHRGGYASFACEITPYIKEEENVIVVRAVDNTRDPLQPSGKQSTRLESYECSYTRATGIWQTVWLEPVPITYLCSIKIFPDIDQGRVTIHLNIDGDPDGVGCQIRAFAAGKEVGNGDIPVSDGQVTLDLSEVNLWEPGNPFLYDLELSLYKDGKAIDLVKSYFGLRQIAIQGNTFLLNNKPYFQRLVLDQGLYPDGIYTAPSDEALRRDIECAQVMGFNGARLHQRTFEERFLYWADKKGYLVWGEFGDVGLDRSHPEALSRVLKEWMDILQRDFNHPSIIGWCPFNETPQTQDPNLLREVYLATKAFDPTRPVLDTSGYEHTGPTDMYDIHNYNQDPEQLKAACEDVQVSRNTSHYTAFEGQPFFVSEYGGIWWNPVYADGRDWGYGERPISQEEFLQRYNGLTSALLDLPYVVGICYTQLVDTEQETNGLYYKYRQPKFDPELIKRINSQPAAYETLGKEQSCSTTLFSSTTGT